MYMYMYLSMCVLRRQLVPQTRFCKYMHTIHHAPCTMHHAPYTIHHTPYTIHHTIHHTPYTIHHTPYTIRHTPYTIHHTPYAIHHTPCTIHHTPYQIDWSKMAGEDRTSKQMASLNEQAAQAVAEASHQEGASAYAICLRYLPILFAYAICLY